MISAYVIGFAFGLLEAVLYVIASSNYDLQGNAAGSVSTFLFAVMVSYYNHIGHLQLHTTSVITCTVK